MRTEIPSGNYSSLKELDDLFGKNLPKGLIPRFYSDDESIYITLSRIAQNCPPGADLVLFVANLEAAQVTSKLPETEKMRAKKLTSSFPDSSDSVFSSPPLEKKELSQLDHDLSNKLNLICVYEKEPGSYIKFLKFYNLFARLRYRHANLKDEDGFLRPAYGNLIRNLSKELILPAIDSALQDKVPFKNYEMFEARSCFRELALVDPKKYAEAFLLRSLIVDFVENRRFFDKNTGQAVEISFKDGSSDPTVFMDRGDLYRILSNLLRDAVVHTRESAVRPIIGIEEQRDCVYLLIYSQGSLAEKVLKIIGRQPYTTQDKRDVPHGYGKVGARKLLEDLWCSLGLNSDKIEELMEDHWANVSLGGLPCVRWRAPIPYSA